MKNIDLVNNTIANKLNIDEKIVKAVNKFYWKQGVKKRMSTLESTSVFVKGFATFTVSRYNVRRLIKKTIIQIRSLRESTKYKETTKVIYSAELYKKLRMLLEKRNELANFYYNECNNGISEADTDSDRE